MPGETLSVLSNIRKKVRRLTRKPSDAQITDAEIDEYINTFILYDFPEYLKMQFLKTTFTFYTTPYIDTYTTNTTIPTDPLYNFKNKFVTTTRPAYVAGKPLVFTQNREQFYSIYPMPSQIKSIGVAGNGVTFVYSGVLSSYPILRNSVSFTSIDANNNALVLVDNGLGTLTIPGDAVARGTINYVTGVYTNITFLNPPKNMAAINSQTYAYTPSLPQSICFFDDSFIIRPVPDAAYAIQLEVFRRPLMLLAAGQEPELAEWWQYIAYGATKKILEDGLDDESVQRIMPEFKKQESIILYRTVNQQTQQRASTIYTEQLSVGAGINFNGGNY